MFWRIALGWAKSVTLLALFGFVNRITISTGLQISLVDPIANAVSHVSGLPSNYSAILLIGVAALGLLKVVIAIAKATAATVRH
jgi:hypothetical protein